LSEVAKTDSAEMRYLLGELSEDEKIRMEDAFFVDDAKFEALELAEDELIDAYVRNELTSEDRRQFTAKLLTSPRLVERVNFARILVDKADSIILPEAEASSQPAYSFSSPAAKPKTNWLRNFFTQQPAWGIAMATCAVLIVVGSLVLVSGWLRVRKESAQLTAERAALQQQKEELDKRAGEQRSNIEQLNAELQREREQQAEDRKSIGQLQQAQESKEKPPGSVLTTIATVFLTPGSLRSGGGSKSRLIIGPETTAARVQLALEKNEYPAYSATIKTVNGATVHRQSQLRARTAGAGPVLLVSIPARLLSPGDYVVHLDGLTASGQVESVSDYSFRVSARSNQP
jgi:hypothetical protein